MTVEELMKKEIEAVGKSLNLPEGVIGEYCHSQRDGDCNWQHCPQNKDGEPMKTGRHCPLDIHCDERYQ